MSQSSTQVSRSRNKPKKDPRDVERDQTRQFSRLMYRKIGSEINELVPRTQRGDEIEAIKKVHTKLGEIDETYKGVDRTNEAVLDAEVLQSASKVTSESTRKLELGSAVVFNIHNYSHAIRDFLSKSAVEATEKNSLSNSRVMEDVNLAGLSNLGALSTIWFSRPATTDFMVGPMSVEYNRPKPRVMRDREVIAPMAKVNTIDMDNVKSGGANMTKLIKEIFDKLRELNTNETAPVSLFEFVLNPYSFSQSIENMFYLSFLVHDGKVAVTIDQDSVPVIYEIPLPKDPEAAAAEAQRRKLLPTNQMIFDLDMETWKGLIEFFEISEPFIPHREPVINRTIDSGAWYSS